MTLRETIASLNLTEFDAMNILQDAGIVSDLCVWASDVWKDDVEEAGLFLKFRDK